MLNGRESSWASRDRVGVITVSLLFTRNLDSPPHVLCRALPLSLVIVLSAGQVACPEAKPLADVRQETAKSPAESIPAPPLRLLGTLIVSTTKVAFIVILDELGKEMGVLKAKEGETVAGYRIAEIEEDQVSLERAGRIFLVKLGTDRPRSASPSPAPRSSGSNAPPIQPGQPTGSNAPPIQPGQPTEEVDEEKEALRLLAEDSLQQLTEQDKEGLRSFLRNWQPNEDEASRAKFLDAIKKELDKKREGKEIK